ncbi:uncharacterized protein MELLADRAFT_103192 [Melampsora larici-populina 98AG31]|uniref:Uncharacterized protein n=1 Tax=Melampsora larici-populina (strain 98AG31 / pathotype 3-4-7) TaxID=747676 RepID=F4RAV3_MELLP|nr:uncharacterized protein MELLADRAFT_103192 [Melampsora larici-populina 98AG31]EGG10713.1 hypothetical protein MELLADRAFT_103192 [Melampsora larici-populina 98AG31]
MIGSLDDDDNDLSQLFPPSIISPGSSPRYLPDHEYESDEEPEYRASTHNPLHTPRHFGVPLLHGGGALSGRALFNRPATLVSPGAEISRPSLKIPRVFGLLDKTGTITPQLEKSTTTSRTDSKIDWSERVKDAEALLKLAPTVTQKTKNQKLQKLAESTFFYDFIANLILMKENIGGSMRNFPSTCGGVSSCKQNIKSMLEVLEEDYLEFRERVWILGLLKGIQPKLSIQDGTLIHSSFQDGSLSRGEFELLLNQSANLAASAIQLWKEDGNQIEEDPMILESFERVELYLKLYEYLKATKSQKNSPEFITIYNTLCQASGPIPKENLLVLVKKCQLQMVHEDITEVEIIPIYHIMKHLQKHYKEVIKNLGDEIVIDPIFESMYASLKEDFEYQEKVQLDVKAFFGKGNGDLYMENLVAPFIGCSKVDLKHYDYVLNSLRAYEDELGKSNPQDAHKITRYIGDKQEIIRILSKASDHIEGAKEYMNQHIPALDNLSKSDPEYLHKTTIYTSNDNDAIGAVRKASDNIDGARKLMKPESPTLANDHMDCDSNHVSQVENKGEDKEETCSICLQDFLDGQCLLKLDCSEKHLYHRECLEVRYSDHLYKYFHLYMWTSPLILNL